MDNYFAIKHPLIPHSRGISIAHKCIEACGWWFIKRK